MSEWISVKDRLPMSDEYVICFGKREYEIEWDGTEKEEPCVSWNSLYTYSGFYGFSWGNSGPQAHIVIASHWMPLPNLPDEENDSSKIIKKLIEEFGPMEIKFNGGTGGGGK